MLVIHIISKLFLTHRRHLMFGFFVVSWHSPVLFFYYFIFIFILVVVVVVRCTNNVLYSSFILMTVIMQSICSICNGFWLLRSILIFCSLGFFGLTVDNQRFFLVFFLLCLLRFFVLLISFDFRLCFPISIFVVSHLLFHMKSFHVQIKSDQTQPKWLETMLVQSNKFKSNRVKSEWRDRNSE